MVLQFSDDSHYDNERGPIDWVQLAKTVDGFAIKFTEGTTYLDTKAKENFTNAKKTGKPVGAYHFYRGKGKAESDFFKKNLPAVDYVAIDCEDESLGDITDEVLAFAAEMNKPVLLYTYPDYLKHHFNKKITKLPLWIAHYDVKKPDIAFYKNYAMWQFTQKAIVKGKTGPSDMDYVQQAFYDVLRPKKKIVKPLVVNKHYVTAKPGDSAWNIAIANHVQFVQLKKLNPSIKDLSLIFPGQKIRIK